MSTTDKARRVLGLALRSSTPVDEAVAALRQARGIEGCATVLDELWDTNNLSVAKAQLEKREAELQLKEAEITARRQAIEAESNQLVEEYLAVLAELGGHIEKLRAGLNQKVGAFAFRFVSDWLNKDLVLREASLSKASAEVLLKQQELTQRTRDFTEYQLKVQARIEEQSATLVEAFRKKHHKELAALQAETDTLTKAKFKLIAEAHALETRKMALQKENAAIREESVRLRAAIPPSVAEMEKQAKNDLAEAKALVEGIEEEAKELAGRKKKLLGDLLKSRKALQEERRKTRKLHGKIKPDVMAALLTQRSDLQKQNEAARSTLRTAEAQAELARQERAALLKQKTALEAEIKALVEKLTNLQAASPQPLPPPPTS